jgi:outer membrane protein assembly factor BamB
MMGANYMKTLIANACRHGDAKQAVPFLSSFPPFKRNKHIGRALVSFMLLVAILWNGSNPVVQAVVLPASTATPDAVTYTNRVVIPLVMVPYDDPSPSTTDWPMVAANPQRTSWSPEEVRGELNVDWYHPIEPYIPYKIQPIASNGKIYVSTARGLYAFSAANGALAWVYPTELPLGNSPTIATVNGKSTAYVGGYDRKMYAIDANTGLAIAGYSSYLAEAGYESNPLVINNVIYAGNRDGYFYALNAATGSLIWRYKTDGAILYSAAYKNGVVYFGSNDAHAYALNVSTGTLVWKSAKLPGEGFHSFWPVVYTDKTSGKDYVIFTSGENYTDLTMSLIDTETTTLFGNIPVGNLIGPTSTTPGNWASGTVVMDASVITSYFQNRPDRRTVFVLDRSTGTEFTFDSNKDGKPEYAPFTWSEVTHAGTKYPPVINGVDGVYYQATAYYSGGWVSRGSVVGWKFGTQYISKVDGNGFSSDEPLAYSSGGKLIYTTQCCDRESDSLDVTIPYGQANRSWAYVGYLPSNNEVPGYQQMYNAGDATVYNDSTGWQLYSGKSLSKNGVYGKHGTTQSPFIPYQGKLFFLKGNSLIALSPTGANSKTPLALAAVVPVQNAPTQPTKADLTSRLEVEVQKMITAGPLRPGYAPAGQLDQYGDGNYTDEREFGEIFDYFQNPADTVYTLTLAYPYLSAATQQQVKTYLQTYYGPGAKYDFTKIVHIGWGSGAARELFDTPSEVVSMWGSSYKPPSSPSTQPICGWCGYWQYYPPFSFYGAYKYAQVVGSSNAAFAKTIFDAISAKLEAPLSDAKLIQVPYMLNLYIDGYYGYLQLQRLAGYAQSQAVLTTYQHLLDLRVNNFTKDPPYPVYAGHVGGQAGTPYSALSVARNFMFLTPELSDYLNQHISTQVQAAINEYNYVAPYWFVSQFDNTVGESTFQPLYDAPALFQAKAWILKQSYSEVVKWLDAPVFYQGDLFYIQNLAAALGAN